MAKSRSAEPIAALLTSQQPTVQHNDPTLLPHELTGRDKTEKQESNNKNALFAAPAATAAAPTANAPAANTDHEFDTSTESSTSVTLPAAPAANTDTQALR